MFIELLLIIAFKSLLNFVNGLKYVHNLCLDGE